MRVDREKVREFLAKKAKPNDPLHEFYERSHAAKFMESMGFQLVHTWQESHGDGGQDIYERRAPLAGNQGVQMVVVFDRGHYCTGVFQQTGGSYLLAKEIRASVAADDGDWKRLGEERGSACGTASSAKFVHYIHTRPWDHVVISAAAGHGEQASWQRSDGEYHCRSCGKQFDR